MVSSGGSTETRVAILNAARRHLENGSGALSMGMVAKEAGVSRQAVYLHFGNRAGLLLALVQYMDETLGLGDLLQPVREAENSVEKIEGMLTVMAVFAPKIQAVARVLERDRLSDEDIREAWEDRMRGRRSGLREALGDLAAEGRLRESWTVERATEMLWALGLPSVFHALVVEREWSVDEYERYLVEVFHGMLCPKDRTAG